MYSPFSSLSLPPPLFQSICTYSHEQRNGWQSRKKKRAKRQRRRRRRRQRRQRPTKWRPKNRASQSVCFISKFAFDESGSPTLCGRKRASKREITSESDAPQREQQKSRVRASEIANKLSSERPARTRRPIGVRTKKKTKILAQSSWLPAWAAYKRVCECERVNSGRRGQST